MQLTICTWAPLARKTGMSSANKSVGSKLGDDAKCKSNNFQVSNALMLWFSLQSRMTNEPNF